MRNMKQNLRDIQCSMEDQHIANQSLRMESREYKQSNISRGNS